MQASLLSKCILILLLSCTVAIGFAAFAYGAEKPNILLILCDDLGYGDVHCLNPDRGKIPTPNMYRLAAEGMVFTDAHSSSSVCTPTRYGLLTGRYNWRSRLQTGVLFGLDPPLIDQDRLTVGKILQHNGYQTACIGKWHLGMDWARKRPDPNDTSGEKKGADWSVDYARAIANGPNTRGFDEFFGIAASLDMPPFVFIENDHVSAQPTVEKKWGRKGPASTDFEAVNVLPTLTRKAVEYIERCAKDPRSKKPFFLFLSLTSPHTPIVPAPEWQGRWALRNPYGDFVMETDAMIGSVLDALERNGAANNTLVVFTSDNGCAPYIGVETMEKRGHFPSAKFRGYKADAWDGGHRIPLIVRWPGVVEQSSTCGQLVCLTDFLATCAEIVGETLPDDAGEDSVSILPILKGGDRAVREAVVHHSIDGKFAIRQGRWKLILCPGSGGWSKPRDKEAIKLGLPPGQLYDMETDPGETTNLYAERPEVVERLTKLLEKYVADGRSTPGLPRKNDVKIDIFKGP